MKYYILRNDRSKDDGAVIDEAPVNGPKEYMYKKLKPLLKKFPTNAEVYFSDNYPDAIKLYDFVDNICGLLIISKKVQQLFEKLDIQSVEYLPVRMRDHSENLLEKADYYILNSFRDIDFINFEKSDVVMNSMKKDRIFKINGPTYIDAQKIPENTHLFRTARWPKVYFVSELLVNAMKEGELSGYVLEEAISTS